MKKRINITASIILKAALLSIAFVVPAFASYLPFNTNVRMNVGIGSANPGQSLDVQGTVRATAFIGSGSGLTNLPGTTQWTTTNTNDVYLPNNGNVGLGTTITSAGAALTVMNGNVGIGTWVPAASLDMGQNGQLKLANGAYNAPGLIFNDSVQQLGIIGDPTHHELFFQVTSSYAIGLGQARLIGSGAGNGTVFGWVPSNDMTASLDTGLYRNAAGVVEVNSGAIGHLGEMVASNVGIGTVNGDNYNLIAPAKGSIIVEKAIGIGTYAPTGALEIEGNVGIGTAFTGGAGEAALTVMNGNVGIGTWLPGYPLVINGNTSTGTVPLERVYGINGYAGFSAYYGNQVYLDFGWNNSSRDQIWGGAGTGNDLSFYNGSVYALEIQGGVHGNIGIGTGSPGGALDIMNGNVGIGTYIGINGALVVDGGNVGIGSNAPSQSLDVQGTVRALYFSGNGSQLTGLTPSQWTTTNINDVYLPSNGNVGIGTTITNAGAALTVMNGNVGIGTWVPSAPLYVNGNTFINGNLNFTNNTGVNGSGNTLGLYAGGTNQASLTNASLTLGQGGQAYPFTIGLGTGSGSNYNAGSLTLSSGIGTGSGTAGSIIFQTANVLGSGSTTQTLSTKMTLQGNGNVGIGTSVPAGVLEIVGNVGIGTINYSPYVTTTPPNGGMLVEGNVGIGTWIPSASLDVLGTISSNPSATTNITAGGGITVTRAIMRIQGSGGAVTVTANPEIAAGQDGQIVVLEGMSSVNTVKLTNGTGLRMAGGISFTLGQGAMITFVYDAVNNVWTETSRSAN